MEHDAACGPVQLSLISALVVANLSDTWLAPAESDSDECVRPVEEAPSRAAARTNWLAPDEDDSSEEASRDAQISKALNGKSCATPSVCTHTLPPRTTPN